LYINFCNGVTIEQLAEGTDNQDSKEKSIASRKMKRDFRRYIYWWGADILWLH